MSDVDGGNELVGPEWRLTSIDGEPITDTERPPFMTFSDEGRVAGHAGVNRLMGTYTLGDGGTTIEFGPLATTMMAGPPEAMALEQQFLAALSPGGEMSIDGPILSIGELSFTNTDPFVSFNHPEGG